MGRGDRSITLAVPPRVAPASLAALLACLVLGSGAHAGAASGEASAGLQSFDDGVTQGALRVRPPGGDVVEMPLRHTEVRMEISAFVARVELEQLFANPFPDPIEAVYVFPLPDGAAVDDMLIQVGDRRIRGEVRLREEARRIYKEAREAGHAAALLEQQRPNIFTQSVANIEPGGTIRVRIRYVERLRYESGGYTVSFPMVVAPRYTRARSPLAPAAEAEAAASSAGPPPIPQETVDPDGAPRLPEGMRDGHDIAVSVAIDAGVPIRDVRSESHRIETERPDPHRARVRLAPNDTIPNKDFILRYDVAGTLPELGLLAHRGEDGDGFFALVLQPKAEVSAEEAAPKEMIFVLDTSGSMSGAPIEMSQRLMRKALEHLGPRDSFNIVQFASGASVLSGAPLANTPQNREHGLRDVDRIKSDGGTEMLKGFATALSQRHDPGKIRIVVFLTDGQIGDDDEILEAVQQNVGESRIFTIGIGTSVNRSLLSRMAALGRGTYTHVRPDGDAAATMDGFYSWVTRPYLTDLSIDWGGLPVSELTPERPRDLFSGQTLAMIGRYAVGAHGTLIVRGRLGGAPWEQNVDVTLPETESANAALASLWARETIASLQLAHPGNVPDDVKGRVTHLALTYHLMSPYTSFVAVDETFIRLAAKPRTILQPLFAPDTGRAPGADPGSSFAGDSDGEDAADDAAGDETMSTPVRGPTTASASQTLVETVTVRGQRMIDLDAGGENKTLFSNTLIADLPVPGRRYQNLLTLAPGVQDTDGDGNPNVMGSRERDLHTYVDGVSNVDPLTGTFMSNVNTDAIEDIEIVTTGASAEYGGAVGGFTKIITKQGSNTFSGTAAFFLRHSIFDGNTIATGTDGESVVYHDVSPSLVFSGPLMRDKLFFLLTHEYDDRGAPVSLLGAGSIVVQSTGTRNLDKLTWEVGSRHKLIFQASSDPLRVGPLGVDALTDPDSGYDYRQGGPTYQVHWDAQVGSTLVVQSLLGMSHTGISLAPRTRGIKNFCGRDEIGTAGNRLDPFGNPGGEPIDEDYCTESLTHRRSGSFPADYSDDRIRYTLKSDANYFLDSFLGVSHTLKAGILAEKSRFEANDSERASSAFTESLARFGGLDSPAQPGGGVLLRFVSVPGNPQVARNVAQGSNYAAYVEDQFRPHPNVSIRVGVRVQQENLEADGFGHFDPREEARLFQQGYDRCAPPGDPARCARQNFHYFHTYELFPVAGASPIRAVIEDPAAGVQSRDPESFRTSNTNVAPRLSLSWDPGTNGRMKIFGTAGRYYGDTFLAVPLYEQPPDTFGFQYTVTPDLQCTNDPNGTGTRCVRIPTIGSDQSALVFPASIKQVDRNLKTPYQDEYTLGFSREIFQETSITVTAIKRSYKNLFQDIDANHYARDIGNTSTQGCVQQGAGGPLVPVDRRKDGEFDDCGGRTVVLPGTPPFFRPRTSEIPDGIADLYIFNPFFNQINKVGNYNKENYKAVEVELNRRLHRNWQLEASYVWSKATGNAEDYNQTLGNDPTTVQDEFGYLSYDQRHVVKVNVTTQLPLWNVRLSSAFTWQSGLPYSITKTEPSNDQPRFYGPFRIAYSQQRKTFPTGQRNDQRNAPFWNFDLAGRKDFTIGKANLEASVDVFNVFNDDTIEIQEEQPPQVLAQRHRGRQFQVGAKLTF